MEVKGQSAPVTGVREPPDERPRVSVIVPARNPRTDWFDAAIESACRESEVVIEVIIVDDGSDPPLQSPPTHEGTRAVMEHIDHAGVARARNRGLEMATGEYIRFLDADDLFEPGSTAQLVEASDGGRYLSYGATQLTDEDLNPTGRIASRLRGVVHRRVAAGRFDVTLPACLFPREAVERAGGFEESLVVQQDWDFVLRVSEIIPVRPIASQVYRYRRHPTSHSSGERARRHAERSTVRILRAYLARHPELDGRRSGRRIRAYGQFMIARLREPCVPMRTRRFWRATAADPLRGFYILCTRSSALGAAWLRGLIGHVFSRSADSAGESEHRRAR